MLVLNDGFVIIIINIIYVYIKSEFSEIIKIDIFLYICSIIWEVIWGFLSYNEVIMYFKFVFEV